MTKSELTLRDGRTMQVRAMQPSDEAEILQAFDRMSDQARYMRFMRVVRQPNLERLRGALRSLPQKGIGLVATTPAEDGYDIVGSAIAMLETDGATAEFALHTASAYGRAGLGAALMAALIAAARDRGFGALVGYVLADNTPMLRLAGRLGFDIARDPDDAGLRICRLTLTQGD